jgi:hypothetical protein
MIILLVLWFLGRPYNWNNIANNMKAGQNAKTSSSAVPPAIVNPNGAPQAQPAR